MHWKTAEKVVASYLCYNNIETTITDNKEKQYSDIDLIAQPFPIGKPFTISVKNQNIAEKTGNFSFELWLVAENGSRMEGNFQKCKADYLAILVQIPSEPDTATLYMWKHQILKDFIGAHPEYPQKGLGWYAKSTNAGRKFKDAINILIPKDDLTALCSRISKIPFTEDLYKDKEVIKTNLLNLNKRHTEWVSNIFKN